jgi:hypothetical protein
LSQQSLGNLSRVDANTCNFDRCIPPQGNAQIHGIGVFDNTKSAILRKSLELAVDFEEGARLLPCPLKRQISRKAANLTVVLMTRSDDPF